EARRGNPDFSSDRQGYPESVHDHLRARSTYRCRETSCSFHTSRGIERAKRKVESEDKNTVFVRAVLRTPSAGQVAIGPETNGSKHLQFETRQFSRGRHTSANEARTT